ncbi:heme-copper oxidase subunit III [Roseivirga sp. BDSF3-8]|uniref:cytochrome c oxidase subunit 3 n=1 Tax=Roseivirga sp. BDSF3-8 TaxID=3241598 RepID=UPI003531B130
MRKDIAIESIQTRDEAVQPLSMHPQKFAMWLFMVSITMMFVALTSAYIVRQAEGNWRMFELPDIFLVGTAVLFLSSATMHWAYLSAVRDNLDKLKIAMIITTILGLAFLYIQFKGWSELVSIDVYFTGGNPSESFVYVFSGLHGAHLISGVIFMIVVLVKTFRYKVHSKNMVNMEMLTTYWHFLDGLWIFLFLFLWLNN